jgi:glucose-1-phosphate cytidylyltransferase
MKVVLFCGGLGTRMREFSETIPKPMVDIGSRPIIWHLMKYYAHFGHKDFILCLGYRGDYIKKYFLNYDETLSNDFVLSNGGRTVELRNSDIQDWRITFVDTGMNSNIGQRLAAVAPYLEGEELFMANYTDGLSDVDLDAYLSYFREQGKIASLLAVRPSQSLHHLDTDESGFVTGIRSISSANFWINGGFFIFRKEIFDYMREGEELVMEPFQRLIEERQLITYHNPGFWACMDTFKEKKTFDEMHAKGEMPWALWDKRHYTLPSVLTVSREAWRQPEYK